LFGESPEKSQAEHGLIVQGPFAFLAPRCRIVSRLGKNFVDLPLELAGDLSDSNKALGLPGPIVNGLP
jgi:hypothetical protein